MREWWRSVRPKAASGLIYRFLVFVGHTLRIKTEGYENVQPLKGGKIVCGWHGKSFIPAFFWRRQGVWVIISQSRDGEMQARIFKRLGFNIIRGSTGRGGVRAAVESIKVLKEGAMMAITPDGPRGPSQIVQGGVMLMAQKSGAALIPIGISAKPCWHAPAWDRYMIPWLFARAILVFGDPIYVPKDADEAAVEEIRLILENEIKRLEAEAESKV